MTKADSERIQSTQVRLPVEPVSKVHTNADATMKAQGGKDMSSGGFAARAQSAGDRNDNASTGNTSNAGGGQSGGQKK